MALVNATVADILRSSQHDELFIREMQDTLQSILKLFGSKYNPNLRHTIPGLANFWYYSMTSYSNLQTLGEEYTGSLRLNSHSRIPSKMLHLMWLAMFTAGEHVYEGSLKYLKTKTKSKSLTQEAQNLFLKIIIFCQQHSEDIKRLHKSLFYINGDYLRISNRLTGIKYVLVRPWMEDNTFNSSFMILGYATMFYTVLNFMQKIWIAESERNTSEIIANSSISHKSCILCAEIRKNVSVTPCGHMFCWDCIHNSLQYQKNCPACRESIEANRIVYLQNYL